MKLSHAQLVALAVEWAARFDPRAVIVEPTNRYGERPDVLIDAPIGRIMIECKASLTDLGRNARKRWRGADGVGSFRWLMIGQTVPVCMVPPMPLWGLVTQDGTIKRLAQWQPSNAAHERLLLASPRVTRYT